MTGRNGSELSKLFEIFNANVVSSQMQHGILQRTGVSVAEHEAITIDPSGVFGRVLHDFGPQQIRHGGTAHGSAGMSRVGSLRLIGRNSANGVDAFEFQGVRRHYVECGFFVFLWCTVEQLSLAVGLRFV